MAANGRLSRRMTLAEQLYELSQPGVLKERRVVKDYASWLEAGIGKKGQ